MVAPPSPADGAAQELPAMAAVLMEQLAEQADAACGLQQAASAAEASVATLAERLAALDAWLDTPAQGADALAPAWLEALRIEVEEVNEALSVFYLGTDPPALGSAVAPAEAQAAVVHAVAMPAPSSRAGSPGRVLRADPFLTH
jgi:hypothetical protein